MALTPWYKVEGIVPREDLREGKGLDAAEFAVHLDQVRDNCAPEDYRDPARFFERTYLTKTLIDFSAQVVRRLSGETAETNAIFNLATQFGGGKTHALTLLYHLANEGSKANTFLGVDKILSRSGIASIPKARIATFVGTEFDSLTGRGGNDGTPLRKTPWGEIAFQLGGEQSFDVVAEHDREFTEPKGDVIRAMLPKDQPCLILMDEILNYVSTYRRYGHHDRLYNFVQALSETARGAKNVVLVVSIPASEMEYTAADEADEQRFKKMLDRLGKPVVMSAEAETSEIIRRRLFEWDAAAVSANGKVLLPKQAIATCNQYADWVVQNRQQLPSWFPVDNAREAFYSTYPFHPTLLSVFERKWQALPRFQRTRGILRLLALWVSNAYSKDHQGAYRDPLISLGTAPLDNPDFRSAVFEQMGDNRLEAATTTDICGRSDAHAIRLDAEAIDAIKKSRLHRKVATTIFFESNGGCSQNKEATLPEIRLDVADPSLDIGNVETVLETMATECYYLSIEKNKYRFSLSPNLNKILADRRANVQSDRIGDRIKQEVQTVFAPFTGITLVPFPSKPSDIANRPVLTLAILAPEQSMQDSETLKLAESIIRTAGNSDRTFKSAVILAIADNYAQLREDARRLLAWEDIKDDDSDRLDESQKRQLNESLAKAKRDLKESVWRAYRYVVLLGKDNTLRTVDLGLITSSSSPSMTKSIIDRLRQEGDVGEMISPRFLVRNWPPAFQEWSTKAVQDTFYSSPQFPRLLDPDAVKTTILQGVSGGNLAYVAKTPDEKYNPFLFNQSLSANDIEISDDTFIITAECAQAYEKRMTQPPILKELIIAPSTVKITAETKQAYTVKGLDQYGQEIPVESVQWDATGGKVDFQGVFQSGKDIGGFYITATAHGISTQAKIDVVDSLSVTEENFEDNETAPSLSQQLRWRGEVPTQKWMHFYSRILSRFASDQNIKLNLEVEFSVVGEISQQKIEETKVAFEELGLNSDLQAD